MQVPDRVDLYYTICLPDLSEPVGYISFSAAWEALD